MNLKNITHASFKRFFRYFLPLVFIIVSAVVYIYQTEREAELTKIRSFEQATLQVGTEEISNQIQAVTSDISFLVKQTAFLEVISKGDSLFLDSLKQDWIKFSRTKGYYDQIRWLDKSGKEQIRVNFNQGEPIIIPDVRLQNKANRYYFKDTIKLNENEFFISPLDLNIEKGKIEQPVKPTIRIGTPVFNYNFENQGVLLLNYSGKNLLQKFKHFTGEQNSRAWLLNRDSFWLKGPSTDMEWGFMYKRNSASLVHQYPETWKKIISSKQGQFENEHGLWTYNTIYPLLDGQKTSTGSNLAFSPSQSALDISDYFWKTAILLPSEKYHETTVNTAIKLLLISIVILIILAYGSWQLARSWHAQMLAEEELNKINLNLKQTIEERLIELKNEIIDRKETEVQLDNSKARLLAVLDNAADGIISLNKDRFIEEFNKAAELIFGYKFNEVFGQSITFLFPQDLQEAQNKDFAQFQTIDSSTANNSSIIGKRVELQGLHSDGQTRDIELSVSKINIVGEISFTAIIRDITAQKITQQIINKQTEDLQQATDDAIAAKNSAEKALKVKSEFLANMSHEIRTPMSAIIGMSHLALQSESQNKQNEYIQNVEYNAQQLLNIINDILDFSKVEAGKLSIEKQTFDLYLTMSNVISLFEYQLQEKKLTMAFDYNENLGHFFLGDSLRISQILTNLIGNAIKFTLEGGVSIKIYETEEQWIRFEIQDTGIGLTEAQQAKLFHSFSQADTSNTRNFGGTGLGLIISKQLIVLMDGRIWLESKFEVGSTFIFELKLDKTVPVIEEVPAISNDLLQEQLKQLSNINILLVEDSEILQIIILETLKVFPFHVDVAMDGKQAVDKFQQNPDKYQLIFMDLQMPVMDGYEACKIIRQFDTTIPIIALSANGMVSDIEKTRQAGMNEHLVKPVDMDKLNEILLHYLITNNTQVTNDLIRIQKLKDENLSPVIALVDSVKQKNNSNNDYNLEKGLKVLPEIYGVNTQKGLQLLNNNDELYLKMLRLYQVDYKNISDTLNKLQQLDSFEELKRYSHKLKGNSGNLGIILTHELASKLEQACLSHSIDSITSLSQELAVEIQKVMTAILEIKINTDKVTTNKTEVIEVETSQIVHLFEEVLLYMDADVDKVDQLMESIVNLYQGTKLPKEIEQINDLIFNFETDKAKDLILVILKK